MVERISIDKMVNLRDYQLEAVSKMKKGCILNGGTGSGKSITSIYYYFISNGGSFDGGFHKMKNPKDLYIITTAMKRDKGEWEGELGPFLLSTNPKYNKNGCKVVVDSWNNIKKYEDVNNAWFIFDEDKVTGYGAWAKAFLKIARSNFWYILSATPGDNWTDYMTVFIANGFYKNKKQFEDEHVKFSYYAGYPKVDRYYNVGRLLRLRNSILIDMDFERETVQNHIDVHVDFDKPTYNLMVKDRWNIFKDKPFDTASELCDALRKLVNSDESRQAAVLEIFEKRPKVIIFYNFDYELEILKSIYYGDGVEVAEWNGHQHQPIPTGDRWVYLVQYTAGCEGWNCVTTNTIIFFSQNYSYKVMQQSAGRTDRMNTKFHDLYYYHLKSKSNIDLAISKALREKKKFNEAKYASDLI